MHQVDLLGLLDLGIDDPVERQRAGPVSLYEPPQQ